MKEQKQLYGKNVFYDRQNRLIYMDPKTSKFFVITQSEVRALYILQNRLYISIFAAAVLYFYIKDVSRVIAAFVVCFFALSLAYKKLFLPRLEEAKGLTKNDVVLPEPKVVDKNLEMQTVSKVIRTSLLSLAVGVLFIVNAMQSVDMNQTIKILHYILAIGTIGFGFINLMMLSKVMKK